jgi:hypothetical protein
VKHIQTILFFVNWVGDAVATLRIRFNWWIPGRIMTCGLRPIECWVVSLIAITRNLKKEEAPMIIIRTRNKRAARGG